VVHAFWLAAPADLDEQFNAWLADSAIHASPAELRATR
jgi:hypothetical protein